jgi:hypothetical protein
MPVQFPSLRGEPRNGPTEAGFGLAKEAATWGSAW